MTKRLTLYSFDDLKEVEDYTSITAIRINNYYRIADFGPMLQRCVQLRELHLIRGFLQPEVPYFMEAFPHLHTLVLQGIPVEPLLPLLARLPNLKRLALKKINFTAFPMILLQLLQLEELSLQGSQLDDPSMDWAVLAELPRLRHLNLQQLALSKQPAIPRGLLALTQLQELLVVKRVHNQLQKKAAAFCASLPYLYGYSILEKKHYRTLLHSCHQHHWSWAYRAVLMNLLAQQFDKLQAIATPELVLEATDVLLLEPLRLHALEYYQQYYSAPINTLLKPETRLAVQGNLSIDKRQLRRQLKQLGIRYQAKIASDTDVLLLGQRSQGAYQQAQKKNIPIVTEKALVQYLAQQKTAYLTQSNPKKVDLEQLEMMLCSGQETNVQLALTMFEQGGFPRQLFTALFWAHQLMSDKATRRALERLLGQHASVELLEYVKSKQLIFTPYSYEASVRRRFKQLEKYPELDVLQLARYGYQRYSKGLFYLLTALPEAAGLTVLKTRLSDQQTLNLSSHDLTTVPPVVFQLSTIKTIDLSYNNQLKTVALKGLRQLPQLEKLVIYGNSKLRNNTHWVMALAEQLPHLQVYYYNLPH